MCVFVYIDDIVFSSITSIFKRLTPLKTNTTWKIMLGRLYIPFWNGSILKGTFLHFSRGLGRVSSRIAFGPASVLRFPLMPTCSNNVSPWRMHERRPCKEAVGRSQVPRVFVDPEKSGRRPLFLVEFSRISWLVLQKIDWLGYLFGWLWWNIFSSRVQNPGFVSHHEPIPNIPISLGGLWPYQLDTMNIMVFMTFFVLFPLGSNSPSKEKNCVFLRLATYLSQIFLLKFIQALGKCQDDTKVLKPPKGSFITFL